MIEFSQEFRVALTILSVYRLSELFSVDDGPFMMFKRFRAYLGKKSAQDRESIIKKSLADLFACPFCTGVWFALFLSFLVIYPSYLGDIFILILGIAGAQAFMESLSNRFIE